MLWKRYAPDNNQAIHCAISAHPFHTQTSFANVRVGSWNIHQPSWWCISPLNHSCRWVINCVMDLIGDQLILCQRRLKTRKLIPESRLHCDADCSSQRGVLALGALPTSWIPQLRHAKVETFLRPESASPSPSPLQVGEKSSLNYIWLSTAMCVYHTCPAEYPGDEWSTHTSRDQYELPLKSLFLTTWMSRAYVFCIS